MVTHYSSRSGQPISEAIAAKALRDIERLLVRVEGPEAAPEHALLHVLEQLEAALAGQAAGEEVVERLLERLGPAARERLAALRGTTMHDAMALVRAIRRDVVRAAPRDDAARRTLELLSDALGAPAEAARSGSGSFVEVADPDVARAERTAAVAEELAQEVGLRAERIDIALDGEAEAETSDAGRRGLMKGGRVYIAPPGFDPEEPAGRALLAHELVHVAQRERASDSPERAGRPDAAVSADGADAQARLDAAEAEAYRQMSEVERGGRASAPSEVLSELDEAACGPRQMVEDKKKQERRGGGGGRRRPGPDPRRDPEPDPERPGGTEDPPPTNEDPPPKKEEPPPEPTVDPPAEDDGGECVEVCPDPDTEHSSVQPVKPIPPVKPRGDQTTIELVLAGHKIKLLVPKSQGAGELRVSFRQEDSPFAALRLKKAVLQVDADLNVLGGEVQASLELGNYLKVDNVLLQVDEHARMSVHIRDCQIDLTEDVRARVDLVISPEGIHGATTLTADEIKLGEKYKVTNGLLHVRVSPTGQITAHGRLTVEVEGFAGVTLEACYVDGEWRGRITFVWTRDLEIIPGALVLERATLTGCFTKDMWTIEGSATFRAFDKFGIDVHAKYKYQSGEGDWTFHGQLTQREPLEITAGVTLEETHAEVSYKDKTWDPATFGAKVRHEYVEGSIEGTWDIEKMEFSGEGEAHLLKQVDIGTTGATLDAVSIKAVVDKNELTEVHGEAQFTLPFQGEPTFRIAGDAHYFFKTEKYDIHGEIELIRELVLGDPAGMNAKALAGSKATVDIVQSEFLGMKGGLAFEVYDGVKKVGVGEVNFAFGPQGDSNVLNGKAQFDIIERWGLPDGEVGPVFLLPGGHFELTVESSKLKEARADNVKFEVLQEADKGTGKIEGGVNGVFDFPTRKGDFNGNAKVTQDWALAGGEWGTFTLKTGGSIEVEIVKSDLKKLEGNIPFAMHVNGGERVGPFDLEGEVSGKYNHKDSSFDGKLSATLKTDLEVRVGDKGDSVKLKEGSKVAATVVKSEPQTFTMELSAEYWQAAEGILLAGSIKDAVFDFKTSELSFEGMLVLKRRIERDLSKDGKWKIAALPEETKVDVTVAKNALTRVGGGIVVEVVDGEGPLLRGSLTEAELDVEKMEFTGHLDLALARDLSWPKAEADAAALPPTLRLVLKKDVTHVWGQITKNEFTEAGIEFVLDVEYQGLPTAQGKVSGTWNISDDKVDAEGSFKLVRDFAVGGAGEQTAAADEKAIDAWTLLIKKDSGVAVKLTQNVLQPATIGVEMWLVRGDEQVAQGSLDGEYKFGDEGGFTGGCSIDIIKDIALDKFGRFELFLSDKTAAEGRIEGSKVKSASGDFVLLMREGVKDKALLTINMTYSGGKGFTGDASVKVVDPIKLGERPMGKDMYSVWLSTETGGSIHVAENKPTTVSGQVTIDVMKASEAFARGQFQVAYDFSDPNAKVTASGSLELIGTLELGTVAGYTFSLLGGTGIAGSIKDNGLEWIEGALELGIASAKEGQFGTLELSGKYTGGDAPEFNGRAIATITQDHDLGFKAFGYDFFLCASSGFGITLEHSELKKFDGKIGVLARQKAKKKGGMQGDVRMELQGDGDKSSGEWIFNGTASCKLEGDIKVGTAGVYDFSIQGGTGVTITVESNKFTSIEGTLKGKVTEKKKDFLGFECWVRYVAGDEGEDGTIDAKGACRLLGEKELYNKNDYVFSLLPTEGPTAIIDVQKNEVKKVGGEMAFRLENNKTDDKRPDKLRIKGFARGEYDNDTGLFSGAGGIFLESDLNFNLTSDGKNRITLETGSGGQTEIVKNELTRLGGTIKGLLVTDDKPLVRVNASGDYNAVTNVLERFEGSATLLRTMELGPEGNPWIIVAQGLQANIKIVDNKLISADGRNGKFTIPALNMEGGFDYVKWSCETGKNVYSGKGYVAFEMLKEDKEKGRKLGGRIDIQYNEDDTWKAKGKVDYRINHYIGGTIDAEMDQNLDPVLGGTLTAGPMNVVDGRELFSTKMTLFKMKIPFAIGVVPGSFNFGAEGYLGLDMLPMTITGTFGVSNFRPRKMNVPDFSAEAELDWGFRMKAGLMAYADLRIDIAIASAGGGLKGIAEMSGDAKIKAKAKLNAQAGKYWGELGIGLSFAPTAVIKLQPYLVAELGKRFDYDFDSFDYSLGEIFKYEWGTTYKFGDAPPSREENSQRDPAPQGKTKNNTSQETSSEAAASYGRESTPSAPTPKPGTPQMETGKEMAEKKEKPKDTSKPPSEMGDLEKKIKFASELGEVAGAAAFIISELIVIIGSMLFGPIVFVLVLCWKWLTGKLSKVLDAIEKTGDFIKENWDLIKEYMPDWWKAMIDFFDDPSSAIDLWWNGDVYTRQAVARGEHLKAPPDVRGQMVNTLYGGWAAEGDRRAIEKIMEFSSQNGDFWAVLNSTDYDGDSFADCWYRHSDWGDSKLKKLWDKHGVDYGVGIIDSTLGALW